MTQALGRSFSSLQIFNYRRYFVGQVVSLSGNWMQMVAETWLVLELTGSAFAVGAVTASQFLPFLLFGAWGGVIADRLDKRRLLMVTQCLQAIPPLILFGLAVSGVAEAWMVGALAFARGSVNAFDHPARQAFAIEMVGPDQVVNAVSLNSVVVHTARMAGPSLAGLLIATVGTEPCFAINGLSFAVMFIALAGMRVAELGTPKRAERTPGALRAAVRYVFATPSLAVPLAMMALVGTLGFNFQVLLPLLAKHTFDGGPQTYGALVTAMGLGAVAGALVNGARGRVTPRILVAASTAFGAFTVIAALAPTFPLELAALVPVGAASVTFAAGVNSSLQLAVDPEMRGRVMALFSVVFIGSTPIGALIAGWLAEVSGPRAGLILGAVACFVAAAGAWAVLRARGESLDRVPALAALDG